MQKFIGGALALIILASCGKQDAGKPETAYDFSKDAYIWLEDVEGEEALAWVEEQNAVSLGHLEALPVFAPLKERNLEIYNSDERIATPAMRGDHVYNFWRDEDNIRGRWRRMLLDDYIEGSEEWELVLDIDLLAEGEDEDWVWKGAQCLRPEYRRCLLNLSRGGADAVVVREFDVETKTFVMDGFSIPEAKQRISWIDENAVWVGSDFGDGSTTDSGYPRTSRLWKRGEPLEEAAEIFAGEQADVAAGVYRSWDRDDSYDVAYRVPSFFETLNYLYTGDGEFRHIDIPADADLVGVMNGQLLVQLKTDWEIAETTYPQAALMSIDFGRFMDGDRDFEVLIVPGESMAIPRGGIITTRDYIIVRLLDDVVSKLQRFSFADGRWVSEEIEAEDLGSVTLGSSSDESNIFFFTYEDFLTPDTLYVADDGGRTVKALRSLPEFFDSEGMTAEQHFATSKDGTRVPYFVVLPKGFEPDGTTPTLMYGYGGFEVSRPPSYSATVGHSWLERGGAFVVANIRGGGEYGPAWHHAALKENRQRAYDDFIAVGEDLIARGITSPGHLGIRGGSNGGLLTGVMLTQRPDLWGGVVIQVPLLDMKRYNKLLAGASWMGEYGDPDTDDWEFIKEYSPY
ncbi:MAG: prolyl oligopeptidase family serine peptidase, partial [Gammaproteobacteria bacterium]|nr:prolyl oligopeptidase family serine peptidase [Gammaproteobacteria bacterium]